MIGTLLLKSLINSAQREQKRPEGDLWVILQESMTEQWVFLLSSSSHSLANFC